MARDENKITLLFQNSRYAWIIIAAVPLVLILISIIFVAFGNKSKYVMHLFLLNEFNNVPS